MQVMSADGELILDFVMLKEHGVTVCEEYYDTGGNAFCAISSGSCSLLESLEFVGSALASL